MHLTIAIIISFLELGVAKTVPSILLDFGVTLTTTFRLTSALLMQKFRLISKANTKLLAKRLSCEPLETPNLQQLEVWIL